MSNNIWNVYSVWLVALVPAAFTFIIGLALGSASHPYERCSKYHNTVEDISECVWLLTNN